MALHEKNSYLNKDIDYLINEEIIEYDMKSAGYNLSRHFQLLPPHVLAKLGGMGKKERQIELGWIQKRDKEFSRALSDAFAEGRKLFYEANDLSEDNIVAIKKDAIFVTKRCEHLVFGEHLEFQPKNEYTSYYYMGGIEFYYHSSLDILDVKGLGDEGEELHADYMLSFLMNMFFRNETGTDTQKNIKYLLTFADHYRNLNLECGYYRELNRSSMYKLKRTLQGDMVGVGHIDTPHLLDIHYNYMNFLVPLISVYL